MLNLQLLHGLFKVLQNNFQQKKQNKKKQGNIMFLSSS